MCEPISSHMMPHHNAYNVRSNAELRSRITSWSNCLCASNKTISNPGVSSLAVIVVFTFVVIVIILWISRKYVSKNTTKSLFTTELKYNWTFSLVTTLNISGHHRCLHIFYIDHVEAAMPLNIYIWYNMSVCMYTTPCGYWSLCHI